MGPLNEMVKTSLFRGPYLTCGQAIMAGEFLYETCAILGRARRNKLSILVRTLPILEGHENDFINDVQKTARDRLQQFGKEPDSFVNFILSTELENIGVSLTDSNQKVLKKTLEEKWLLKEAEPKIKSIGVEGLGFGSSLPELTEKMWKSAYESVDTDQWSEARAYGLILAEKPTRISYEEHEQSVLEMVANYTSEHYPDLVDPLDLHLHQSE